ncbi:hypothetical protein BDY24DRAFT_417461 [Mrakia frigida]|uniref:uncharacterized protein n=1 Tax=Mrakia frigida TaxID=29902 RepID=UPI003FCBFA9B
MAYHFNKDGDRILRLEPGLVGTNVAVVFQFGRQTDFGLAVGGTIVMSKGAVKIQAQSGNDYTWKQVGKAWPIGEVEKDRLYDLEREFVDIKDAVKDETGLNGNDLWAEANERHRRETVGAVGQGEWDALRDQAPGGLAWSINATPDEKAGLGELLLTMGVRRPGLRILSFEMPGKERRALFHAGGLISATSRILLIDMLTKNIPTEMISGLVVLHAEKVTITSMEAFIVRLYRESNHDGWLKALSDDPEHFNSIMTPLQTCMKMLSLRRVTLWPRFHASVHASLGQRKADVVELYQPLTTPMKEIQNAIVELDDFTVENALFRHFDRIVRGQLDPIWHRVGPKTKRLVSDLTTLRNLLNYLLSYDSITFHTYLESILTAAAPPPGSAAPNTN